MDGDTDPRPALDRDEWAMLEGLLRQELQELPSEIHHTDSREFREDLQARREALTRLLDKIRAALAA